MPKKPSCHCGTCNRCKTRARMAKLRSDPTYRAAEVVRNRRYRSPARHAPIVRNAHAALNRARSRGAITPEPCLFCDEPNTQAHHHDYSQPLQVTWLCPRHHALAHR